MRPFSSAEQTDASKGYSFQITGNSIREAKADKEGPAFNFDQVFTPSANNDMIFDQCASPIVQSCLNGYNGVIFAYGQTSSGKTHSMFGSKDEPGIIPRAIRSIFDNIKSSSRVWLLRCSFLEIYNEEIHDLLSPNTESAKLKLVEVRYQTSHYFCALTRYRNKEEFLSRIYEKKQCTVKSRFWTC